MKWFDDFEVKAAPKFNGSKISEDMKWAIARMSAKVYKPEVCKDTDKPGTALRPITDKLLKDNKVKPAEASYIIGKLKGKCRKADAEKAAVKADDKEKADFEKAYNLITGLGLNVTAPAAPVYAPAASASSMTFEQMLQALPRK